MHPIILIEDNEDLSKEIKKYMEKLTYQVSIAENIEEAKALLQEPFDIALLDINLPDGSGMDILDLLKSRGIKTIIITAKNEDAFIVQALDSGADDFMVKPFSLAVLRARVDLALRESLDISENQVRYKNFLLDETNQYILLSGEKLELTVKEMALLALFIKNPHRLFTRDYLLEKFWDTRERYVNDNTLTVTIKRLREKIKGEAITTIRGIGYRLD